MPPSLSKMICNQHIVCLGTFIKRLASHLPNIIRRRLHDAGSPEAGAYNKTNLDDEPLQARCPMVRGDLLWDFLQNLDMMQWQCGLQHPHQLQWIRTPSFLNIQCIFMDWLYVKMLHNERRSRAQLRQEGMEGSPAYWLSHPGPPPPQICNSIRLREDI